MLKHLTVNNERLKVGSAMNITMLVMLLCFALACTSSNKEDENALPLTLVRRSVLDQKIRMVSLRFGEDRFAAYDLENGHLDKIWRGGVSWNGAAFTNQKTVQPESYGASYWENDQKEAWTIEKNGQKEPIQFAFKAYHRSENGITFEYALINDNGATSEIRIFERPQFLEVEGKPYYQRIFSSKGTLNPIYLGELLISPEEEGIQKMTLDSIGSVPKPIEDVSVNGSQYWLDRSGCNTCHDQSEKKIGPSYEAIAANYNNDKATRKLLTEHVKNGNVGVWGPVAMIPHPQLELADIEKMISYILSLKPKEESASKKRSPKKSMAATLVDGPGFGAPLEGIHPSYDLQTIRPANFKPRVGGMAFLPDGRLLVSTWDSIGAIYALSGVETGDTNQIEIKRIADGLSEPLGLTTVGDDIFVLQKHELTQLIDHDDDEIIDEYRSINHSFAATPDFHEFSYGLTYKDGYFYGTLGLAMRLMSSELQLEDRGTAFKIGMDGSFEIIARGLRQPNGIGIGLEDELFVLENQGQWVPACKFIHLQPGKFYGCEYGMGDRFEGQEEVPPAVWLPQDEIGNSPGQPLPITDGPYDGQMTYGEVTHGGLKRVFLEKIAGEYQGCVFRFTQGLEAGIIRTVKGPDGGLYVGGVGMNGNWSHKGNQYGLQKLKYNNSVPFELLAVRAKADGFELEFTKPLAESIEDFSKKIAIQQWYYETTAAYGGPKLDLQELTILGTTISEDRKKVVLHIPGLKKGYVVYFRLSPALKSQTGETPWSGETWYTLNNIPEQPEQ